MIRNLCRCLANDLASARYWLVSRLNGEHKAAMEYRRMQEQHIARRMAEARAASVRRRHLP